MADVLLTHTLSTITKLQKYIVKKGVDDGAQSMHWLRLWWWPSFLACWDKCLTYLPPDFSGFGWFCLRFLSLGSTVCCLWRDTIFGERDTTLPQYTTTVFSAYKEQHSVNHQMLSIFFNEHRELWIGVDMQFYQIFHFQWHDQQENDCQV